MTINNEKIALSVSAANTVDDALAKVSELGTVGAMKWLAHEFERQAFELRKDANRYRWLRSGHMEFGVQPDSDTASERGDWFWVHAGDCTADDVDNRVDNACLKFPVESNNL